MREGGLDLPLLYIVGMGWDGVVWSDYDAGSLEDAEFSHARQLCAYLLINPGIGQ